MIALFTYVLAVCATQHGILVHYVELMSTHPHLGVTDTLGVLPDFLRDFHRLVALGTKALRKWEGAVWDSNKTSVVALLTPQAIVEKAAYCMANPVAAGLVRRAGDWPGLKTLPEQLGRAVLTASRPKVFFDPKNPKWPETASLTLTLPPSLEGHMTLEEFQHLVAAELAQLEKDAHAEVAMSGRSFLGADRCRRVGPYHRAKSFEPLRGRNPTFAVGRGNPEARLAAAAEVSAWRAAYRKALLQWRAGNRDVAFPEGTWAMRRNNAVQVMPLAA